MGHREWFKDWTPWNEIGGGVANSITNKNIVIDYNHSTNTNIISSIPSPTAAVLDSGTTGHYLTADSPCENKQILSVSLPIKIPNGAIIHSSHTALLQNNDLPLKAREVHIFPESRKQSPLIHGYFLWQRMYCTVWWKQSHHNRQRLKQNNNARGQRPNNHSIHDRTAEK